MEIRLFIEELARFNKEAKPISSFQCPAGYQIVALVGTSDGGQFAFSSAIYVISTKKNHKDPGPRFYSYLIFSKTNLGIGSIPILESYGMLQSVRNMLMLTMYLAGKLTQEVESHMLIDSSALAFVISHEAGAKNIKLRNNCANFCDSLEALCTLRPESKHSMGLIRSEENASDLASKEVEDSVEVSNSKFWRHGHPLY